MVILHVTGARLTKRSGITGVLDNLPTEQNKIDGVKSYVFVINNYCEDKSIKGIEEVNLDNFDDRLKNINPDLVIIHDFYVPFYGKLTRIIRKNKIKYLLEPHGAFGRSAMKKSRLKKIVANHTIFRNTIKKATGFIFTTDREAEDSVYHSKNDVIIQNGVNKEIAINSLNHKKENIDNPVFYFMGRFRIYHKGIDILFDALDIIDRSNVNINFNVYGTSTDKEIEYVNSRISALKNINIKYCGAVYGSERDVELNNCNILVLTSRYEGSPLAVLDAFSYGNAVVASQGTNVSKEIVDNNLGWETNLDPQVIADTILKALEDYKKHGEEYINRTLNYVLENYTWEKMASVSIKTYEKIIKSGEK